MSKFKSFLGKLLPKNEQSEDGRDQWPSRTAFLLAAVGGMQALPLLTIPRRKAKADSHVAGAVGQGNIIRYPSQVSRL